MMGNKEKSKCEGERSCVTFYPRGPRDDRLSLIPSKANPLVRVLGAGHEFGRRSLYGEVRE